MFGISLRISLLWGLIWNSITGPVATLGTLPFPCLLTQSGCVLPWFPFTQISSSSGVNSLPLPAVPRYFYLWSWEVLRLQALPIFPHFHYLPFKAQVWILCLFVGWGEYICLRTRMAYNWILVVAEQEGQSLRASWPWEPMTSGPVRILFVIWEKYFSQYYVNSFLSSIIFEALNI